MAETSFDVLRSLIRDVPDHPEPGIVFKDITPLLADAAGLSSMIAAMAAPWRDTEIDLVLGLEARGFILGAPVAAALGAGFVPARKAGRLPLATLQESYGLEYGVDTIEVHVDAVATGARVLVIDDVLATGGTASAAGRLLGRLEADLVGFGFLIELAFLDGRAALGDARVERLVAVED